MPASDERDTSDERQLMPMPPPPILPLIRDDDDAVDTPYVLRAAASRYDTSCIDKDAASAMSRARHYAMMPRAMPAMRVAGAIREMRCRHDTSDDAMTELPR